MRSSLLMWGKFLIGWPLSFLSLAFIIKLIIDKSGELKINASEIDFTFLLLGVLFFFIYFLLRSFLWWLELEEKGYKLNFRENTYRYSFSQLKRYTPGNVWSFLSLGEQFSRLRVDKKTIAASILADIQLVIIGCSLASVFAIPWIVTGGSLQTKISSLLPISGFAILIYFFATGAIYKKKYGGNKSFLSSFFLPGFSLNSKLKLSLVSLFTYFLYGVANYFVFASIFPTSINIFITLSSFFVFSLLIGYLSFITPMGLGVRELIVTLGLSQIMSTQDAGAISIFSRIILIVSELLFLLLVFIWEKSYSKT